MKIKMKKSVFAGLLCLVLGFISLNAVAQTTPKQMVEKGWDCQAAGKNAESVEWMRKAAEQGYAEAQNVLGDFYYIGVMIKQNYAEAVKWSRKAADQGHAEAQCRLGKCYYYGFGVEKNFTEAFNWFLKSAKQGNMEAEYEVGMRYYEGEGVKKDYSQAKYWFKKAEDKGFDWASAMLEMMYDLGL